MSELNIVNENDEIIGKDTRENIHKSGLLHREIHIWIFNDKGEILLQRRSETKDTYPGLLDVSVGGHVEIGDDYEKTAIRELAEEVGINAGKDDLIFLNKLRRNAVDSKTGMKNNTIRKIFAYKYSGSVADLKLEIGEATSLEFWPLDKILNLTEKEKKDFVPALADGSFSGVFEKLKSLT
jgi:isopentenyl-diphosphate delta-isomerase type 1